jgi:hypothetical protein
LVSRDPVSLTELAQRSLDPSFDDEARPKPSSLVETLFSLLKLPEDPLALVESQGELVSDAEWKRMKVGKKEKAMAG